MKNKKEEKVPKEGRRKNGFFEEKQKLSAFSKLLVLLTPLINTFFTA